jgi:hypothetical protein
MRHTRSRARPSHARFCFVRATRRRSVTPFPKPATRVRETRELLRVPRARSFALHSIVPSDYQKRCLLNVRHALRGGRGAWGGWCWWIAELPHPLRRGYLRWVQSNQNSKSRRRASRGVPAPHRGLRCFRGVARTDVRASARPTEKHAPRSRFECHHQRDGRRASQGKQRRLHVPGGCQHRAITTKVGVVRKRCGLSQAPRSASPITAPHLDVHSSKGSALLVTLTGVLAALCQIHHKRTVCGAQVRTHHDRLTNSAFTIRATHLRRRGVRHAERGVQVRLRDARPAHARGDRRGARGVRRFLLHSHDSEGKQTTNANSSRQSGRGA